MAVVEKSVLIEHTAAEMFKLVDDVEHYPAFLPWCGGVDLQERTETLTVATLHINFQGIKANFSTEKYTWPTPSTYAYPRSISAWIITSISAT